MNKVMKKRNTTLSVRINDELKREVQALSEQEEISIGDIVTIALVEYIKRLNKKGE